MTDNDMQDTRYLFQPRGSGTAYLFRFTTPDILVGRLNPRTGKPYGKAIREGLGGVKTIREALRLRDLRLGSIRVEEALALGEINGSSGEALEIAAQYRAVDDPDTREAMEDALIQKAEAIESRVGTKKAVRWYKMATGEVTPFNTACDQYKADRKSALSISTVNNLNTAIKEFHEYAGEDISLQEVDRHLVGKFVMEFLPNKKNPKAPNGQGPATIQKKVSQLSQVWRWAITRGLVKREDGNPWTEQAPEARAVKAATTVYRIFTPEESKKLLDAAPLGTRMGDTIRVALLTGVRLEEVVGLDAAQVDPEGRWYYVKKGKTDNAPRFVPLVDKAQDVIKARMEKVKGEGPLFPDAPLRPSTGKRGGAVSQEFTRLRRTILGNDTDGELKEHCFRHTWRTMAGRADIGTDHMLEMGGWAMPNNRNDKAYDHHLEEAQYRERQLKVAQWMRDKGYLG